MIGTKIGHLGVTHLSRVPHQVADPAMEMRPGMVEILPIADNDQVRNLGRMQQAAVPASDCAREPVGGNERTVLGLRKILEPLVGIISQPWYAVWLIQPDPE